VICGGETPILRANSTRPKRASSLISLIRRPCFEKLFLSSLAKYKSPLNFCGPIL
jgi:hypothetical protein